MISVVIATYQRRELLERTLPTVLNQRYPASDFEVVVVSDGSTDGTMDYLQALRSDVSVTAIAQPNRGPAAARNAGIKAAAGDVVAFLDDDIRADPLLLAEHMAGREDRHEALIHGTVMMAPESPKTLAALATARWYDEHNKAVAAAGLNPEQNVYLNANTSIPRDALLATGGFDTEIPFPREDFELGLRLWREGVPFVHRPEALAYEIFSKSTSTFGSADAIAQARADVAICRKHPSYRPRSPLAPPDPPRPISRAMRVFATRAPGGASKALAGTAAVAERLLPVPGARRVGLSALGMERRIRFFHTAAHEIGSPSAFEDDFDRRLPVLLYHHVGDRPAGMHSALNVERRAFRAQVDRLSRSGYVGIRPGDWLAWRRGEIELPRKPVLFTFDDGYAALLEYALPVLQEYGFGALVFVPTGELGNAVSWTAEGERVDGPRILSEEEVSRLATAGIDFGSHTRTHRPLDGLSQEEIEQEVRGSQRDLEGFLPAPVPWFAYPFGQIDPLSKRLVADTYDLAFVVEPGLNGLATPPHRLRRTAPHAREAALELLWRARMGSPPLGRVRTRLADRRNSLEAQSR